LITDTSLDYLARRLRFLGYDVVTLHGARLEQLFDAAAQDGRTLLTLSSRHPRRYTGVPAIVVPRGDPMDSLRMVVKAGEPSGPPFSRCACCNHLLVCRPSTEATGTAPDERVWSDKELDHCPSCGRWYWYGSHVDRVCEWLEEALGRPVRRPSA
jgi:hypothetical protein